MTDHTLRIKLETARAERRARRLDRSMGRLQRTSGGLTASFAKLGAAVGGLAVFSAAARDMVATVAATDRFRASLETVTGSAEMANTAFGALTEFAKTTPFTMDQSVQGFIKLKALGLDPTAEAMTSFGNTAAAMGLDLNQMVEAVADATTGEFERLKEFGIKASSEGDRVKFTFQGVTTEIGKNATEIQEYLEGIGNVQFAGAMERQMDTLPGLWSNLRDSIEGVWRAIGDAGATEALRNALRTIIDLVEDVRWAFESGFAQATMRTLMDGFVQPIAQGFEQMKGIFADFFDQTSTDWGTFWGFLVDEGPTLLMDTFVLIPTALQSAFGVMLDEVSLFAQELANWWDQLLVRWQIFVERMAAWWTWWINGMKQAFADFAAWFIERLGNLLESVGASLASLPGFGALSANLTAAGASLQDFAAGLEAYSASLDQANAQSEARIDLLEEELAVLEEQARWIQEQQDATGLSQIAAEIRAKRQQLQEERRLNRERANSIRSTNDWRAAMNAAAAAQGNLTTSTEAQTEAEKAAAEPREEMTDQVRALEERLDPVLAAEREWLEVQLLLEEALRNKIIPTQERYNELLEQAREKILGGVQATASGTTQVDSYTKMMERGAERIEDAFGDMWKSILEGGELSLDGIRDAFNTLLSDMINEAITRPITLQFRQALTGGPGQAPGTPGVAGGMGNIWGGLAMAGGVLGGTALGGGGEGAQLGSSIGTALGASVGGPVGALVGGILGGLAGGLFDDDPNPAIQILGTGVDGTGYGTGGPFVNTPLGGFQVNNAQDVGDPTQPGSAAYEFVQAVREFDIRISRILDDNQLTKAVEEMARYGNEFVGESITQRGMMESRFNQIINIFDTGVKDFINAGADFEERLARFTIAAQAQQMTERGPDSLFFGQTLEQVLVLAEMTQGATESLEQSFDRLVQSMTLARQVVDFFGEFTERTFGDLVDEARDLADDTFQDTLERQADAVLELVDAFDGTLSSAGELAAGLEQFQASALQAVLAIDSIADTIETRFANTREQLLSQISTPFENRERMRARMDSLAMELASTTDATRIAEITAEIDRLARATIGSLETDAERNRYIPEFIQYLEEIEELAQAQLERARDEVAGRFDQVQERVIGIVQEVTDPFLLVVNEFGIAVEELYEAARALYAGETGDFQTPGGPIAGGGPGPQDPNPVDDQIGESVPGQIGLAVGDAAMPLANAALDLGVVIENTNETQRWVARVVSQAIQELPERIQVEVVNPAEEFGA